MMDLPPFFQPYQQAVATLCRVHGVRRLEAFGSVVRDDFDPNSSDIDLVVEFDPAAPGKQVAQYFGFKSALEDVLQRPVDLIELQALPDSRLKRLIVRDKVPVYETAA